MAAVEEFKQAIIPNEIDDDDEKASLKAPNEKTNAGDNNMDNGPVAPPSLTRRMSSQFVNVVERQKSVVDNIGLTSKINQVMPEEITRHIPGLNRRSSKLKLTYFCNICFTKRAIDEGFTLRKCQHQFCPECIETFMKNKIDNGVVNLTCFYPMQESEETKACGDKIDEEDIHQIVNAETWGKYEKFKANLENTYSRQCPFCNYTQNGDAEHAIMICENKECGKQYCLYHSNAHSINISCEEYELSMAKETKMNENVIHEMGRNGANDVAKCPQCKFTIIKNGGCNHMKCVKCGCSFCWICHQIIEDEELPSHYKDSNSPCKGQQFTGMDSEPPPKWIMLLLVVCIIIFCIPSTALAIVCGCLCFPFVLCCDCRNSDTGDRQSLFETMFGCWLIWLIIFIVLVVFIPIVIIYIIWEVLKALYAVIRICMPCLPVCPNTQPNDHYEEHVGGR